MRQEEQDAEDEGYGGEPHKDSIHGVLPRSGAS